MFFFVFLYRLETEQSESSSVQQRVHSPSNPEDKEPLINPFTALYPLDDYLPPQGVTDNQIIVSPLENSEVLKETEDIVNSCNIQLEKSPLYPPVSPSVHSRNTEEHSQHKKDGNTCTSKNHLKTGVEAVSSKAHVHTLEQEKCVHKTVFGMSFPKVGYMCPNNSFASISEHDTKIRCYSGKDTNQGYKIITDQKTTENMTLHKKSAISLKDKQMGSHVLCPVHISGQFQKKLLQNNSEEIEESPDKTQVQNLIANEQIQNVDKISVETNTEPGIPFRNTPNTAVFSVKVQQTSTRTDEKKLSPRYNLQKTLQRQELPSVNIRPELSIQSGPTINISANGSTNIKQMRKNVDITNIICYNENTNQTKEVINGEGNRFVLQNNTKTLEGSENPNSYVKVKPGTQPNENLLYKHKKFKNFVKTFTTKLHEENSRKSKHQNQKLLQTLQSLSSNIDELYANFQYAVPSYQERIMTRLDKVTQLLEYELQDEDSVTDEHHCRLDEFFQQLTISFQQEQSKRLWQKNVSVPPQDFTTFKSNLESRSNLGRQEQICQPVRSFQNKTRMESVTNMNRTKQAKKQDNTNSDSKGQNKIKSACKSTISSPAFGYHNVKQVSFGKSVQKFVTDRRNKQVLRNTIKNSAGHSLQVTTKQNVNATNDYVTKVNIDQKLPVSDTTESWQAERMKVIQKIHEQLSEIELQVDSDNKSKLVIDSSPESNITAEEVGYSKSTVDRDSEINKAEVETTQNQSPVNEDIEAEYADDWEADGDDDSDGDHDNDNSHDNGVDDSHGEDSSNKSNEISGKSGNTESDCNDDINDGSNSDDIGDNGDNSSRSNECEDEQDYVQDSLSSKSSGKSDVPLPNSNCEDVVPSVATSIPVNMQKNKTDEEEDLVKVNSSDTKDLGTISDSSSMVPIKSRTDVSEANMKVSDKDCVKKESSVVKETEICKRSEMCVQTDMQDNYANTNVGTQIDVNDCVEETFKYVNRNQKKLCTSHVNDSDQSDAENDYRNILCKKRNTGARVDSHTQTNIENIRDMPLQSDLAENVYEVSLPDYHVENSVILKTRGKSQNIQFIVNIPNDASNRQVKHSRQIIYEGENVRDNDLATSGINVQGPPSSSVPNVLGVQKSELIKDVIEPTVEQVLKKYNESTGCIQLVRNETLYSDRIAGSRAMKSSDEVSHTAPEPRKDNLFDLKVPNISLETNTEFWRKLREAADVITNAASQCTKATLDNQIIQSDNQKDVTTCIKTKEIKETEGNTSNQKPENMNVTNENTKQHNVIETNFSTKCITLKQNFPSSSSTSEESAASTSSCLGILKKQKSYRTNKTLSVNPVVTLSDGELCLTSSICSCSVGEIRSTYCQYCQSKKYDTSQSEDLSVGELKRKSTINRNKKYYNGRKLVDSGDWIPNSEVDNDYGQVLLRRENKPQSHVNISIDDTSTTSEGEVKYGPKVNMGGKAVTEARQMKLQNMAYLDYRAVNYGSIDGIECNIKTSNISHNKSKEMHNNISAVGNESSYKYVSQPQSNIQSGVKSVSKSFAEVAKNIIDELKKEKLSNLEKYNTVKTDASFKDTKSVKEMTDAVHLKKHEHFLQNLESSCRVTAHDVINSSDVKEVLSTANKVGKTVSKAFIADNSKKNFFKFQDSEDGTSNKTVEMYADNKTVKTDKTNKTLNEKDEDLMNSSNFKPIEDKTKPSTRNQHIDLSVGETTKIDKTCNDWKILNATGQESSSQDCKLSRTNNVKIRHPVQKTIDAQPIKTALPEVKLAESIPLEVPYSSTSEHDVEQVPLQITAKSEHLVIHIEKINSCNEVVAESKDISEPSSVEFFKDSSSSVSYDDLPGIYEIDFDLESKSSGELLPGIPALDSMDYTEYDSKSNDE